MKITAAGPGTGTDKTTDVAFYFITGVMGVGLVAMIGYILYLLFS